MPPISALCRAAALGALSSAFFPSRCAQCVPELPSSVTGAPDPCSLDAVASMRLQDQAIPWDIELDEFDKGYQADTAQLQILRLGVEYTDPSGDKSPIMRIVGFFPGIPTPMVYQHLTNVGLRRAWDTNYTHFVQFGGASPALLEYVRALRRPLATVTKKRPQCSGDVCTLVPDVTDTTLDAGWFCHRVGGPLLRRFGLVDRLFQYERVSYAYRFTDEDSASAPVTMYDVLYSGSKGAREAAAATVPPLGTWLRANRDAVSCEEVDVNFQHVVLIPIADAQVQLFGKPERLQQLCTMGSMLSEESSKLVYTVFKDTQARTASGAAPLPGTLLVMTSANNVSVPALLPRWAQRTVSSSVSRKAYGQLMKFCLEQVRSGQLS